MAEFHYLVKFDSETKKWAVDPDITAYMPDGNVWTEGNEYGWDYPNGDLEELIDQRCYNMLYALVPIWPEVDTEPMP